MNSDLGRNVIVGVISGAVNYGFDTVMPNWNPQGGAMTDAMTTAAGVFTGKMLNTLVTTNLSALPGAVQSLVLAQNMLVQPAMYGAGRYLADHYYYHTGDSSTHTVAKGVIFGVAGEMVDHMIWANQPSAH
jgi:hypothetical protein